VAEGRGWKPRKVDGINFLSLQHQLMYMFKEDSANKLIEYIQTLSTKEQRLIAERITEVKGDAKKKESPATRRKKTHNKEMSAFLDSLGHRLPKNYKFNREEANER
jgi:hypothetical protein